MVTQLKLKTKKQLLKKTQKMMKRVKRRNPRPNRQFMKSSSADPSHPTETR